MLGFSPISATPISSLPSSGIEFDGQVIYLSVAQSTSVLPPEVDYDGLHLHATLTSASTVVGTPAVSLNSNHAFVVTDYATTGEWVFQARYVYADYATTGEWVFQPRHVDTGYAATTGEWPYQPRHVDTGFAFSSHWREIKPEGFDTATMQTPVLVDFRLRSRDVQGIPPSSVVQPPVLVDFRYRSITVTAGISAFAGGWVRVIGYQDQYITMCDLGFETFSMEPTYLIDQQIYVKSTQKCYPAGLGNTCSGAGLPRVEFRNRAISVRSIQTAHTRFGVPACLNS